MRTAVYSLAFLFLAACGWIAATYFTAAADTPLYKNPAAAIEDRVDDLLSRMTLEEKLAQLSGDSSGMATPDNERLGIPGFKMADGPNGVRHGKSTCFPCGLAMAATWDPPLIERLAAAMGREFRAKGCYVALAPCINIIRDPRGGRSFETMGEDPYLIARIATAYVRGMQSQKVIATPKHYACNNQENGRGSNDVQVDERALREVYLPHFRACVQEAGAWAVMAAYNKVRGQHCTQNSYLLQHILKNELGFPGLVMSDWGATHTTVEAINAGLDLEMPHTNFFGEPLTQAVTNGQVSQERIDDAVRRVLRAKFWAGVFDRPLRPDESQVNTPEHRALAREVAAKALVLLKNEHNLLPLDLTKIRSIAVIGPNADEPRHCGGGSSYVTPYYSVTVLDGIKNKVGDRAKIQFAQGCTLSPADQLAPLPSDLLRPPDAQAGQVGLLGEYFNNMNLEGEPVLTRLDPSVNFDWGGDAPAPGVNPDLFSVRWRGFLVPKVSGSYTVGTASDDGVRLFLDGKRIINDWRDHAVESTSVSVELEAGRAYEIRLEYYENRGEAVVKLTGAVPSAKEKDPFAEAHQAAANADVAVVAVGTSARIESEGFDRQTLRLPGPQDQLVQNVWRANRNTIVLVVAGSAVLMDPWIEHVPAVLQCWFGGQELGNAVADVLFGTVNPGGKLPVTFPRSDEQLPLFDNNYETVQEGRGYRYFDAKGIEPLFPFGFGLSYTRFQYGELHIAPKTIDRERLAAGDKVRVWLELQNVGNRSGDEIVQLYVHDVESSLPRPPKELKGFQRVSLQPREKKRVAFALGADAFSFYDPNMRQWVAEPGQFEIMVGPSSRHLPTHATLTLR